MAFYKKPRKPIYDINSGVPPTDLEVERMEAQANSVAEWWLAQSAKSRKEIMDKILKKGIIPEIAEKIVSRYEELGYIDDEAYAEQFVYSKTTYDKLGKRSISFKLKEKGISEEIIQQVLENIDDEEEEQQAKELALKKARTNKRYDTQKRLQQIVGLLVRKGYSGNIAFRVAKEAISEEPAEEDDLDEFIDPDV